MSRRTIAGLALVTTLAACRTLVGIDDLSAPPQGPDGGNGNGQGNQGDGAPDNGPPAISDKDDAGIQKCIHDQDCRKCCKTSFSRLVQALTNTSAGAKCVCQDSTCKSACSIALDGGAPGCNPGALDPGSSTADQSTVMACVQCEDDSLSGGNMTPLCSQLCGNDSECFAGLSCLQNCH